MNKSVFVHSGFSVSYRSYNNHDSIAFDPYTFSDSWVTTNYSGYRVDDINYKSSNYSAEIGAGYEIKLQRLRLRAMCGVNYVKYTKLNFEFMRNIRYTEQTDTTSTGGSFEEVTVLTGHETWEGPKLWGVGVYSGAEIEFRITPWIGFGASANFSALYSGLKNGKWVGKYNGTQDVYDTNGYSSNYVTSDEAEYELDAKRFEFSPITAQFNAVFYFGQ